MSGWSRKKRLMVERAFYAYLTHCAINSKDAGSVSLGENLYYGQRKFITAVFDSLEKDIHDIYVLKSRQLGISTISRALTIFMLGIHPGLKGAIIFDTDSNKQESRAELEVMIDDLPSSLRFPRIKGNNRAGLTLANNSKVLFMSAGIRKSKTSGTLGRSVGLSLAHLSEICSYDNEEGLEAFRNSLSDSNPDRLYIYESTARGFNQWNAMWKAARADPEHCCCVFLGWYDKDSQRIGADEPDFLRYGRFDPTEGEIVKIKQVKEQYGIDISKEQLAWYRRKIDPSAQSSGDDDILFDANPLKLQEQPWTEEEAFQQSGSVFFANEKLTEQTNKNVSTKFQTYMFNNGATEFTEMYALKAQNYKSAELKIWEEPDSDGVYCLGIDPAFGENENNDRSGIQVIRCYADGADQVAEYAWPLITTRQLAWVIAALLGWYGAKNARVHYCLELNGPGMAVWNAMRELKDFIERGYRPKEVQEKGLENIFANVRTYMYARPDSIGIGTNYHFKTNLNLKIMIMERLRDFVSNGMLRVRSLDLIDEMRTISREGDSIKAPGTMKDDRALAMALAVHCWETKCRRELIATKRTREADAARKRLSITDQVMLFQQNQLEQFFKAKQASRTQDRLAQMRQQWRFGGRRY